MELWEGMSMHCCLVHIWGMWIFNCSLSYNYIALFNLTTGLRCLGGICRNCACTLADEARCRVTHLDVPLLWGSCRQRRAGHKPGSRHSGRQGQATSHPTNLPSMEEELWCAEGAKVFLRWEVLLVLSLSHCSAARGAYRRWPRPSNSQGREGLGKKYWQVPYSGTSFKGKGDLCIPTIQSVPCISSWTIFNKHQSWRFQRY